MHGAENDNLQSSHMDCPQTRMEDDSSTTDNNGLATKGVAILYCGVRLPDTPTKGEQDTSMRQTRERSSLEKEFTLGKKFFLPSG
mmetsp:Transcript_8529/g.12464  ORF Transcript_8529/g.12464 Transcript_8529/m.12464 type:complete len:85 (+) Transcript_8529:393-647(+)